MDLAVPRSAGSVVRSSIYQLRVGESLTCYLHILGGGKIDYRARDLLKGMLRCFGIPFHEAPGEAEAECARLQILGLVDAVWSQDSDCLMFGCTLWLRDDRWAIEEGTKDRSKGSTDKNKKYAKIVRAEDLQTHLHLDREALVLFAMLAGGDYGKGLVGCGPKTAMKVVKRGLGQSLCMCRSQQGCDAFGLQLDQVLRASGGHGVVVPHGFPDFKTLVMYNSPKVSSDESLRNSAKLNLDNARPINELKLLEFTSSRFSIWGLGYMNWVGLVLLTRYMSRRSPALPRELLHGIRLTERRINKTDNANPAQKLERKLKFSPFGLTSLQRKDFEGERQGYWDGDSKTHFDPNHRVTFEIPKYWLRKVLPPEILDPPPPEPKKRRPLEPKKTPPKAKRPIAASEASEPSATAKKKQKTVQKFTPDSLSIEDAQAVASTPKIRNARPPAPPSERRDRKIPACHVKDIIEISDSEDKLRLPVPRRPMPSSVRSTISQVIDFGSPSSSEVELDLTQLVATGNHRVVNTLSRRKAHRLTLSPELDGSDDENLQLALRLSRRSICPVHRYRISPARSRIEHSRHLPCLPNELKRFRNFQRAVARTLVDFRRGNHTQNLQSGLLHLSEQEFLAQQLRTSICLHQGARQQAMDLRHLARLRMFARHAFGIYNTTWVFHPCP
jgi:Holliday junction resolvase YEN1